MSDLLQRDYYKIFTGTNQEDGYDNIHLGYESLVSEIALAKDKTTFFHIPFFAAPQNLFDSDLIANGATPGPIPAMADRIMKKQTQYGKNTNWGTSTPSRVQDGSWLCSWLYAVSSEAPKWLDRYYNPGRIAYEEALKGEALPTDYIKSDLGFYDVPTSLILEPEVYYQYYHVGEKSVQQIIDSFSGQAKRNLRFAIDTWSVQPEDTSIYKNKFLIDNLKSNHIKMSNNSLYSKQPVLDFHNTDFIYCGAIYNDSYNLSNEFTISLWVHNKDWQNATSTQLAGNLYNTGYGIFYNNLKSSPFFVIPENTYGSFFYGNQDGNIYNNSIIKNNFSVPLSGSAAINLNSEVIIFDTITNCVYKFDHIGNLLAISTNASNTIQQLQGEPKLLALSGDNSVCVVTTSGLHIFNQDLQLRSVNNTPYNSFACGEQMAFDYYGTLVREPSCYDIKFDGFNAKWTIGPDKKVYSKATPTSNTLLLASLSSLSATNLAIDPENFLWVLGTNGSINKINVVSREVVNSFTVGPTTEPTNIKNISFINSYNRQTNTFTWMAVLYQNLDQTLYHLTLDGQIIKAINLPTRYDYTSFGIENFDKGKLAFTSPGDFTGYECRRIFNRAFYNFRPQIQFKIGTKRDIRNTYASTFMVSVPANEFLDDSWHFITCTYKNDEMQVYIDGVLAGKYKTPNNYRAIYENKNNFYFGTPSGKIQNLNYELNTKNIIWNGSIGDIKIYDYAIEPKYLQFLTNQYTDYSDLVWNIPTTNLQYVEKIERFFKHRVPGIKSTFFNLIITGSQITDKNTQRIIEQQIFETVQRYKPVNTDLLTIQWIN
jgi:hypothetical protein